MRWYEKFDEEVFTYNDEYYEDRGRSLLALFLSLLLYTLLLVCIFLEIPCAIIEQGTTIPLGNELFDQLPRRSTPARVVSLPAPTQKKTPRKQLAQPAPAQPTAKPISTPPIAQPAAAAPTPVDPVALPAASLPVFQNSERNGGIEAGEASKTTIMPEQPRAESPLPTRRGRNSWLKDPNPPSTPAQAVYQTGQAHGQDAFSGLENISAQNVSRFPACDGQEDGEPSYGSPLGSRTEPSAKAVARNMEFELFATRLVHNVCDTSRQQPFSLLHCPISTNTSVVSITITRNRKITAVHFLRPSPSKTLDAYIERIICTTTAPLLPASWHEETITIPLSINMRAFPGSGELTLIPAKE